MAEVPVAGRAGAAREAGVMAEGTVAAVMAAAMGAVTAVVVMVEAKEEEATVVEATVGEVKVVVAMEGTYSAARSHRSRCPRCRASTQNPHRHHRNIHLN